MIKQIFLFHFSLFLAFAMPSCRQKVNEMDQSVVSCSSEGEVAKCKVLHPYGGWSCPDNVLGFPAVDLAFLNEVPVVKDRLPTREETRNGTSLMYFDTLEIPSAKPLQMELPRVARYRSGYTNQEELVVVIQAIEAKNDTVVGFRNLNGGNGSAWFREVTFLSDQETQALGATPFFQGEIRINAGTWKIWEILTAPEHAARLGAHFGKDACVQSDWKNGSEVHFTYSPDRIVYSGKITSLWPGTYAQVDYNVMGKYYSEKFLLLDGSAEEGNRLMVVAGPYGSEFEERSSAWHNWMEEVKWISEQSDLPENQKKEEDC